MVVRLKSISRRIHWSLALRAAIFALAWIWLPFWLFFLVALYLYFIPWFHVRNLVVPFFALLILSYLQVPSVAFAFIFGVIFYVILLIKGLLVIDRRATYELLVFVLSFFLLRDFYARFNEGAGGAALCYAFLAAALIAWLMGSFIQSFHERKESLAVWLAFLLFSQIIIVGLFLPVDFIYQSAVVFLVTVLIIDLVSDHLSGGLTRTKLLTAATALSALFVIVLGSARWGL
jgi:hypothetical protein